MNSPTDTPLFSSVENEVLMLQFLQDNDIVPTNHLNLESSEIVKRKSEDIVTDEQNSANTDPATAKRLKLNQKHEGSTAGLLACPFFKRDGHNTTTSRACRGPGYGSISRVKSVAEHIYRCHAIKNQCNRCRKGFDSPINLAEHQRNSESCPILIPLPGTVTGDQIAQLRPKRMNGSSDEEKWRSMYRILFPGDTFAPSPYYDEPCGGCVSKATSRLLSDYRQYQHQQLAPLVQRELAAISHSNNMSDDLCAQITNLLSQLSIKVLDDFQKNRRMDSGTKEPIACSSQRKDGLEDTKYEIMQSSPSQTVPVFNHGQESLNDSTLHMTENFLDDFDFGLWLENVNSGSLRSQMTLSKKR